MSLIDIPVVRYLQGYTLIDDNQIQYSRHN